MTTLWEEESSSMSFTPTTIWPLPSTPDAIFTDLLGDINTSQPSDSSAFDTGIDRRDNSCVVCPISADSGILQHCHIIPRADKSTWEFMRDLHYIPSNAKSVEHEPRNGILMCPTHHAGFDSYQFYIRWISETNTFVAVNHSQDPNWEALHGNVLHFNTNTKRCPFPTAFLWHEYRVRGFHPTRGDRLVPIKKGGLQGGGLSGRGDGAEPCDDSVGRPGGGGDPGNAGAGAGEQVEAHGNGHDDVNMPTFTPMRLEGDSLAAWLKAAREHSSWKDCVVENTSWDGTAAENIEKYQREVGVSEREG